jgi:putative transposase
VVKERFWPIPTAGSTLICLRLARARANRALIERFNKTYRDEVLDAYVFESIEQVREVTETWLQEYNEGPPHDSLGRVPPLTFMPRPQTARESSFKLCP